MKNNKLISFIVKNWPVIIASICFLTYQLLISHFFWNRSGNLPPSFNDSFLYIFNIKKVIKYHTLFPQIPYLGSYSLPPGNLTYISYNLIMGIIGILIKISAAKLFFYSFFLGKVLLLLVCIFFLRNVLDDKKYLLSFVLLTLGAFVGDGAIHGFFWIVPSFWMLLIFFLFIGIINLSTPKINLVLVFLLCFLYITIHPLSIFSIGIFILYFVINFFLTKKISKKTLTVVGSLIICAIIWQIFVFSILFINKRPTSIVAVKTTFTNTVESNNIVKALTNPAPENNKPKIDNSAPTLPQIKIFDQLIEQKQVTIPKNLASFIPSWNSYFSWFFRLPFLLILLFSGFYILYKNKRWSVLSLYLSCLTFTIISLIHPLGYRSLLFLFPVTIIFLSVTIFDLMSILKKSQNKLLKSLYFIFCFFILIGLIGYGFYGIKTVSHYSQEADYSINTTSCVDYIKKLEPKHTQILFTSEAGINYFLNQDIEQYIFSGINNFDIRYLQPKTILIVEDYSKIKKRTDIVAPITDSLSILPKVKNNLSKVTTHIECGIFQLFDISNIISSK